MKPVSYSILLMFFNMVHNNCRLESCEESGEEEDCLDDYTDEEVVECVCTSLANTVLSTVQGQHALVVSISMLLFLWFTFIAIFVHAYLYHENKLLYSTLIEST